MNYARSMERRLFSKATLNGLFRAPERTPGLRERAGALAPCGRAYYRVTFLT
jgi:hypothetical protein